MKKSSRPDSGRWFRRIALVGLAIGAFTMGSASVDGLHAQQRVGTAANSNQWEVLEGCRLVETGARDGDSFHVQRRDREYVFRLYFVDAPEIDNTEPTRVEDQAAYFGVTPEQVLELGRDASQFTAEYLKKAFIVVTRWQNAQGKGNLARFYGIVLMDGKNLAAELVRNGLARIHGLRANWPDGPRSSKFANELKNLEIAAREQRLGAWDDRRFPRTPSGPIPKHSVLVDLNEASIGELMSLPGIGKTLGERIIANRPYQSVEDLKRVKGLGAKTLERIRPLIMVGDSDGKK
jgi:competence protein ComEA